MATETTKKSASSGNDSASGIKVGIDSKAAATAGPRKLKLAPSRSMAKKILIGLIAVAVIIVGFWLIYGKSHHIGDKVYAQAAGHKIYKKDVQDLIGSTKGVSDHQAATVLADKYLTEALAKEEGVTVTDKDIQAAYGSGVNINKQKTADRYAYQAQVNGIYFDKLGGQYQGIYKGDVLVAHFSRYIPARPVSAAVKQALPQMGDANAIAADKLYAKNFLTGLYDQLKAGKITWDQAIQDELNDPTLGQTAYPALSHSGSFDTSKNQEPLFTAPSAQAKVNGLKAGEISKPFVVTVFNPGTSKSFESYFLVVKMESKSGGHATGDFSQYLAQSKKRLGYHVNV